MKIISIYPWTHISSACLSINDNIVSAIAEERLERVKWSTKFPLRSIKWCLDSNNLQLENVDDLVVPWNPAHNINSTSSRWDNNIFWRGQFLSHIPSNLMKIIAKGPESYMTTQFGKTKIYYLNHHDCHAASSVIPSKFKNTDYLTIDGHGETETCIMGHFNGKEFRKINQIMYPHSVGLFYGTITDFLGFKPDNDEWKTMALASYSKNNKYLKIFKRLYKLTPKGFELNLSYFDFYLFDKKPNFFNNKLVEILGKPRSKNSRLEKKHFDIAYALQKSFEEIVIHLLKITKRLSNKSSNICLSGGAAMNCVFNGVLDTKYKIYKNVYIPPWPDDLGVSLGANLLLNYKIKKKLNKNKKVMNVYLGPCYTNKEIESTLKKYNLIYSKPKNLYSTVAKKISEQKLIGWFQDRMEFSHRALGNRSILADPRYANTKDVINKAVKYRENFRPFAPSVLGEKACEIFEINKGKKIEYMEKAVIVRKNWKKKIPAVTHVDGTARVQTVFRDTNLKFYKLIDEFYQLTGVPVLVNTSFNLNGEPIVENPSDAIRTFYTCGLDVLVLGDYIIEK